MSEGKTSFGQKIKSGKIAEIAIAVLLLIVVAVLLLSSLSPKDADSADFAQTMQTKLAKVLSRIEGAGEVEVFLTVAAEGEKVVATESLEISD